MAPTARTFADRIAVVLGSFGLSGFFPVAPATFASAVVTPFIAWAYRAWPGALPAVLVCVGILLVGVWSAGRLEKLYGKDPSAAVIDEVLGMALTLALVPLTPATLLLGFILFRILDVVKLPPGRALERLHGGWGIMLDDASAGIYGCLLLHLALRLWPSMHLAAWQLLPLGAAALLLAIFRKPLLRRYGKKRCDPRLGLGSGYTSEPS